MLRIALLTTMLATPALSSPVCDEMNALRDALKDAAFGSMGDLASIAIISALLDKEGQIDAQTKEHLTNAINNSMDTANAAAKSLVAHTQRTKGMCR